MNKIKKAFFVVAFATFAATLCTPITKTAIDTSQENAVVEAQEEQKQEFAKAFASLKAGFLSSLGDNPYLMTHFQLQGDNERFKYESYPATQTKENNFGIIADTKLGYGSCTKGEHKFKNGRKVAGETLAELLRNIKVIPTRTIDENPLVELYKNCVPMLWQLKSADEVRIFATNLERRLQELNISASEKPLLALTIKDDRYLATLTEDDLALLTKRFELVSLENEDVKKFFAFMFKTMNKENYKVENGNAKRPHETTAEKIFHNCESFCEKWEENTLIPAVVGGVALLTFKKLVDKGLGGKIASLFSI